MVLLNFLTNKSFSKSSQVVNIKSVGFSKLETRVFAFQNLVSSRTSLVLFRFCLVMQYSLVLQGKVSLEPERPKWPELLLVFIA